ncbi:MAG: DUF6768 family protein [Planctomycetota bacterium]
MNDLDRRIQEALQTTPAGLDLAREQGVAEELIGTFKTRHRWIHAIAFVFTFACFVSACYSGYRFAIAAEVHDQLMWGGLCGLGLVFTGFLKMYFWLEIHTNRMLRELKRVELLLVVHDRRDDSN